MSDMDDEMAEAQAKLTGAEPKKHGGGWPKGKPRTARPDVRAETVRPTAGIRERKRKGGNLVDQFALPPDMMADFEARGMSVEWKRETVYGATDPSYAAFLRDQAWEPVDASRFPDFGVPGATGPIRRNGQILMERPIELTREAMAEEQAAARDAVSIKEAQLKGAPPGQFQRHRADGSSTVAVRTTVERGGMSID